MDTPKRDAFLAHDTLNLRYVRRVETTLVEDGKFEYFGNPVKTSQDFVRIFGALSKKDREHAIVLYLDGDFMPIGYDLYIGAIDMCLVDPRQIFKVAWMVNAVRFVVAHNHPQGNPKPSQGDQIFCLQLSQASGIMGFSLQDFIVIGHNGYHSFVDQKEPALGFRQAPQGAIV